MFHDDADIFNGLNDLKELDHILVIHSHHVPGLDRMGMFHSIFGRTFTTSSVLVRRLQASFLGEAPLPNVPKDPIMVLEGHLIAEAGPLQDYTTLTTPTTYTF